MERGGMRVPAGRVEGVDIYTGCKQVAERVDAAVQSGAGEGHLALAGRGAVERVRPAEADRGDQGLARATLQQAQRGGVLAVRERGVEAVRVRAAVDEHVDQV